MYAGRSKWLTTMMSGAGLAAMLGRAQAAATPAQTCQLGKNNAVGKYADCRQQAEAKFAKSLASAQRTINLLKCAAKYQRVWPALEAKAVAKGGVCPSVGDQAAIQDAVDQHTGDIATALGGGVLQDCSADLLTCQGSAGTCTGNLGTCNTNLTTSTGDLGACNTNLTTCQAAPQGQRLKTGQTLCYDESGTVIPCAGTGQDGEFQKGLARSYTDNGNGTITDNRTGLMWEKLSDDGSIHDKDTTYTWTTAVTTKVAALNSGSFGGFTDWRLPNRAELESLVNLGAVSPSVFSAFNTSCAASCTVLTCSCTQSGTCWSSSTYQINPPLAWGVVFTDGNVFAGNKSSSTYVRGVRGGS